MHVYLGFSLGHNAHTKKSTTHNPLGIYVGDKNKKDGLKATCIPSKIRNNCLET